MRYIRLGLNGTIPVRGRKPNSLGDAIGVSALQLIPARGRELVSVLELFSGIRTIPVRGRELISAT